jgi:hypothetical protein
MTRADVNALCAEHGVPIDGTRQGAGKFVDLIIGTGRKLATLEALRNHLIALRGCENMTKIDRVTNPEHDQYGQIYLSVESFWNE